MRYIIIAILLVNVINLSAFPKQWRMIDNVDFGSVQYRSIDCYDSLNCVAVGNENWSYPFVRLTSDGGKTWHTVLRDTIIRDEDRNVIWWPKQALDIAYPDSNLIFVLCDFGIYWYSTTQGKSWVGPVDTKKNQMYQNWCSFYNSQFGAYLADNKAWITNDTCKTFLNLEPEPILGPDDLSIPDSNKIFMLCYYQGWDRLYYSSDKGQTWEQKADPPFRIRRILFLDSLYGYACGGYRVDTQTDKDVILRTTNGGNSWEIQLDTLIGLKNQGLIQMSFYKDKTHGVAIGYKNKLFYTLDSGNTWFYDQNYDDNLYIGWPADAYQVSPSRIFLLTQSSGEIWEKNIYGFVSVDENNGNSTQEQIRISPNPAMDYIEITIDSHAIKDAVKVFNVLGMEVLQQQGHVIPAKAGISSVRLDVSGLPTGVYFICVGGRMYKFVKM